jgi:hypothetical protein
LLGQYSLSEDGKLVVTKQYNENLERLMGRTVESFGSAIDANGSAFTPFLMQV